MTGSSAAPAPGTDSLHAQVRGALIWRSGSPMVAQLIQWAATFLVIRLLDPSDYALYAMAQVMLVFLTMLNGYGPASGLVRAETVSAREVRQVFGMPAETLVLTVLGPKCVEAVPVVRLLTLAMPWMTLPVIGARPADLAGAIAPTMLAAIAMTLAVAAGCCCSRARASSGSRG